MSNRGAGQHSYPGWEGGVRVAGEDKHKVALDPSEILADPTPELCNIFSRSRIHENMTQHIS